MKCRLCGEDLNDRTLLSHLALSPSSKVCAHILEIAGEKAQLVETLKQYEKLKQGPKNTLIARAIQTGLSAEVNSILSLSQDKVPPLQTDPLISLLGTIQSNQAKDGGTPEGFIEELREIQRRIQKKHSIQIGPQSPKIINALLDQGFQEVYRRAHGDESLEGLQTQIRALEEFNQTNKAQDMLGGDVVDWTKSKCIQLKGVSGAQEAKFCVRLREAALQLQADPTVKKGKREIPPLKFRNVADIRILNVLNPAYNWTAAYFSQRIGQVLSGTDPDLGKGPHADLKGVVQIVRVTAAFGKKNFQITSNGVVWKT